MQWLAGLARQSILPTEPVPLAGYFDRRGNWSSVNGELNAKALALKDSAGNLAILITADLLGFSAELSEAICERIQQRISIPREAILLNGSHTHSGPLAMGRSFRGAPWNEAIGRYFTHVVDVISSTAIESAENLSPACLSWSLGVAEFVINRRQLTERGVQLGDNPRGLADRGVPVLRVESEDGTIRAVVFGAACHNVTNDRTSLVLNGDYAGHAQCILEKELPGTQAMFVLGCAGDARPHPRGDAQLAVRHGQQLATEVIRVLSDRMAPVRGPLKCALDYADLPLRKFSSREEIVAFEQSGQDYYEEFAKEALAIWDRGDSLPDTYRAPLAVWQFGEDLTLVGLSGEVVVDFVPLVEQAIGPLRLWIAGYCNDMFGYLPSARILAEGGYETRGLYTGVGLFAPSAAQQVMAVIDRMAARLGRINGHPPAQSL